MTSVSFSFLFFSYFLFRDRLLRLFLRLSLTKIVLDDDPEKYRGAPVSLQLVGRRYEDEKVSLSP